MEGESPPYTDATATGEVNFVKTTTADQDTGIRVAENTVASIKEGTEDVAAGAYQIKEVNGEKHLILTAAYLKSLTDGNHILTAAYDANGHAWEDGAEGEKPADSTITVVVSRAQGVVTILGEQSKVYDGSPVSKPSITTENDRGTNNANVTIEYKVKGADDSTYTKEAPKDYGTYVVRVTVAQDDSHTEAVVTKEFSITKKRMTLTAEDYSGTYDGQKHAITVTVTDPADVEISYRASENASWQSTPVTYRDAGTYTVYYQVTSENYETETGSRTITITPKTVALTWGTTTFTYDGTEKIPTVTVDSSSLYSGDSCQVTDMKGAQKAAGTFNRMKRKSSLLFQFPHTCLMIIFPFIHQSRRKFIDVTADAEAILANQNYLLPLFAIEGIDNDSIRFVDMSIQLQIGHVLCPGCHVVKSLMTGFCNDIQIVHIQESVIGGLGHLFDRTHGFYASRSSAVMTDPSLQIRSRS